MDNPEKKQFIANTAKAAIFNLFYPAILGTFIFELINNSGSLLTFQEPISIIQFLIALCIISFFVLDYLYGVNLDPYKCEFILMDFVAIISLTFSFFNIGIRAGSELNHIWLFLSFLFFFFLFVLYECYKLYQIGKGREKASDPVKIGHLNNYKKLYKNLLVNQAVGFVVIGFLLIFIHKRCLKIQLALILFGLLLIYFIFLYTRKLYTRRSFPPLGTLIN